MEGVDGHDNFHLNKKSISHLFGSDGGKTSIARVHADSNQKIMFRSPLLYDHKLPKNTPHCSTTLFKRILKGGYTGLQQLYQRSDVAVFVGTAESPTTNIGLTSHTWARLAC